MDAYGKVYSGEDVVRSGEDIMFRARFTPGEVDAESIAWEFSYLGDYWHPNGSGEVYTRRAPRISDFKGHWVPTSYQVRARQGDGDEKSWVYGPKVMVVQFLSVRGSVCEKGKGILTVKTLPPKTPVALIPKPVSETLGITFEPNGLNSWIIDGTHSTGPGYIDVEVALACSMTVQGFWGS